MQGLACTAWLVISGYMSGRSLNTVKGSGYFLGQETLPQLHSTGLFQQHNLSVVLHEQNRLLLNRTKIYKYKTKPLHEQNRLLLNRTKIYKYKTKPF